ncbi:MULTISPECIES: MFS transporter [Sphingobium]|nr:MULTISPECIES: MFS transporter [Sphingobium]MBG6120606.1 maltose/moltooligosaccharide transporter [Sphingobium sp. JAI105]PSO11935.1 MFS transporter [Sphingobium sp. AEW4]TWD06701.1 maltose/moltooligosaccharide transporter [Sphingobium sp. AEW010]TWD23634.1 maltose/moltooligosaccharide transporter [Sphingobium sp. AEW013]TWD26153.1 maltose/moltooligosaccharide transporter [Sphingobium sp. AEW001]
MSDPTPRKPHLSLGRIVQMNLGFLGLQFSFGLQQSNMGPIYSYLGADEASLPLLWLAGPMTGLLVQPIIGAMSDRTVTRFGRRTPYFLIGAILCSLCLFAMPYSRALWVAASLLWVLDAANNVTMEPYRAYVSDRLDQAQRPLGFLTQSAFTGLAQTLSYLAPSLLVWGGLNADAVDPSGIPVITRIAFIVGAVLSLSTILWSVLRVPELPLSAEEIAAMRAEPLSARTTLRDLKQAIVEMPVPMRQLAIAMLFQWYAMFCYWQFVAFAIARSLYDTADSGSAGFRQAVLVNGQIGGFYNFIAFIAAFAMVPIARKMGARPVHAVSVAASGIAMLALPYCSSQAMLFIPMIGIGLGWASMMGNPYIILADSIPPARTGIYMGIFNMFIVIPMMIESLTMPLIYRPLLGGDPRHVLMLAGVLMLLAAVATLAIRERPAARASA